MSVEVKLSRSDRVYHAGEDLLGEVVVSCGAGGVQHSGIRVCASGSVSMRVSERAVGVFEAFFLNVRPISLLNETVEARDAAAPPCGRLRAQNTRTFTRCGGLETRLTCSAPGPCLANRWRRRGRCRRACRACRLRCRCERPRRTQTPS